MKKLVILFALVSLSLVGCGKPKSRHQIKVRGADARGTTNQVDPGTTDPGGGPVYTGDGFCQNLGDRYWSIINDSGASLKAKVQDFVSAHMDPNAIGDFNLSDSGVYLLGGVTLQNNASVLNILSGNGQPTSVAQGCYHMAIYDDLVGTTVDGQQIPYIPVFVAGVSGSVSSNGSVNISFSDEYGSINLTGNVNGQTFNGNVSYRHSGSSIDKSLGGFQVATCGFFYCN